MNSEPSGYQRLKRGRQSWWRVIVPAAVVLGGLALALPFVGAAFTPIVCIGGAVLPLMVAHTAARTAGREAERVEQITEPAALNVPRASAWDLVRAALFEYRVWLVVLPAAAPGMFVDLLRVLPMMGSGPPVRPVLADHVRQAAWIIWPGLALPGHAVLAASLAVVLIQLLDRRGMASGIAIALMVTYLMVSYQTMMVGFGTGIGQEALNIGEIVVFVLTLLLPYGLSYLALRLARR